MRKMYRKNKRRRWMYQKHQLHRSVRSTGFIMRISNLGAKLASKDKDEVYLTEEARKIRKSTSSIPTTCSSDSSVWTVKW